MREGCKRGGKKEKKRKGKEKKRRAPVVVDEQRMTKEGQKQVLLLMKNRERAELAVADMQPGLLACHRGARRHLNVIHGSPTGWLADLPSSQARRGLGQRGKNHRRLACTSTTTTLCTLYRFRAKKGRECHGYFSLIL